MLPHDDDTTLILAARSGDRAAFSRLYTRFAPMVHAVLLARVNPADADDLVQEVFLVAMRKLHTLDEPAAAGPWLVAIARNAAAAHHRARRPSAALPDAAPGRDAPEPSTQAREALEAIRSLPETYRETLLMRLVEGLTGPEIAARTGMTHGSVRINLHRGMALLRERLGVHAEPARPASPAPAATTGRIP